jgi:rare lipoprotein A
MSKLSSALTDKTVFGANAFLLWLCALLLLANSLVSCSKKADSAPTPEIKETQTGIASFYGRGFHGRETASGETFDKNGMVAAHPSYPLGTQVRVTNLENNQSVEVRIIDRGPSPENQSEGVLIDVSESAAATLKLLKDGRAKVRIEVLEWGTDAKK